MLEWINRKFGTDITELALNEIKDFTLLWNIFDNTVFRSVFSIAKLEREIQRWNFDFNLFRDIFLYFQNRYIEHNITNERFVNLNFRQNDREELVRDALLDNNVTENEKILAIGIIVYRFRNNLFHGVKDFHFLNDQRENFAQANSYLRILLTD
jgi:hypothetical protein